MSIVLQGSTSGSCTLQEQAVAGNTVLTLPTTSGTLLTTATPFSNGQGPAFSAIKTNSQIISNGTLTKIQFNAEEFDTANCFDSTTNYRFTPNVAGYYQFNAQVRLDLGTVSGSGEYYVAIYKNGSMFKRGFNTGVYAAVTGQNVLLGMSSLIYANGSTDYFELYVVQYSTNSVNISFADNPQSPYFQAALVRAA